MRRRLVNSSSLRSLGEDSRSRTLEIEFHHAGVYQYYGVPKTVLEERLAENSLGGFFNTHKCLERPSGVLPDRDLTEYAYSLAKADRYQEAIDVLDMVDNPSTPRALNYRGYATRKLGRTDEGIGYYLKSVALDPNYSQVREYLGEAY